MLLFVGSLIPSGAGWPSLKGWSGSKAPGGNAAARAAETGVGGGRAGWGRASWAGWAGARTRGALLRDKLLVTARLLMVNTLIMLDWDLTEEGTGREKGTRAAAGGSRRGEGWVSVTKTEETPATLSYSAKAPMSSCMTVSCSWWTGPGNQSWFSCFKCASQTWATSSCWRTNVLRHLRHLRGAGSEPGNNQCLEFTYRMARQVNVLGASSLAVEAVPKSKVRTSFSSCE